MLYIHYLLLSLKHLVRYDIINCIFQMRYGGLENFNHLSVKSVNKRWDWDMKPKVVNSRESI